MLLRRPAATIVALVALLVLAVSGQADARKGAGVKGVVLDATCHGPCVEPQPQTQPYAGEVSVVVRRAADGVEVASQTVTDGRFRIRLKRGLYDVGSVPPGPPPCTGEVCPAEKRPVIAPCETGETQRVRVHRKRFTRVELHVQNVCVL